MIGQRLLRTWFLRQLPSFVFAIILVTVFELVRLDPPPTLDGCPQQLSADLEQRTFKPSTGTQRRPPGVPTARSAGGDKKGRPPAPDDRPPIQHAVEDDPRDPDILLQRHRIADEPRGGGAPESSDDLQARIRLDRDRPWIDVDSSRPVVNPHPFRYVINCPDLCVDKPDATSGRRGGDVFLLSYVHTAVEHFDRRARIRRTWANQSNYDVRIATVFFVGISPKNAWYQEALEFEARKYGDIVQEDYLDTYRNLSYKGIGALKWITTYCNHTHYIVKTDDDVFVNMFTIIHHLTDLRVNFYRRRLILCLVWWRMHVLREGQWGIPREDLADDLYPVYCSGMGFIFTIDVAVALYHVSYHVPFFWVDDAFVSGFLPRGLNHTGQTEVRHIDMGRAYCGAQEMPIYNHETEWYKYTFTHVHDERLYKKTWDGLVQMARRHKTIPSPKVVRPGLLADEYIPKQVLFPEQWEKRKQKKELAAQKKEEAKEAERRKAKEK